MWQSEPDHPLRGLGLRRALAVTKSPTAPTPASHVPARPLKSSRFCSVGTQTRNTGAPSADANAAPPPRAVMNARIAANRTTGGHQ